MLNPEVLEQINAMSLPEAAIAYANMGMRVFPLRPGEKGPMENFSWKEWASSDPATVTQWWQQAPNANIGLVCGPDSGVDAIDLDRKNGKDGWESYCEATGNEPFPGPVQMTPSGGCHLLIPHTPGLKNFVNRGPHGGVDMRTTDVDGKVGYIAVSPSVTGEGRYLWASGTAWPFTPERGLQVLAEWSAQSNTVIGEAADMPLVPNDTPPEYTLNLDPQSTAYLERGELGSWPSRSEAIHAIAQALYLQLRDEARVFGVIVQNPYCLQAGIDRRGTVEGAMDWLWKYCVAGGIQKAKARDAANVFNPVHHMMNPDAPTAAIGDQPVRFFESGSQACQNAVLVPEWIVRGYMERGQVGILYGDSRAFKSYIALDLALSVATGRSWHGADVLDQGTVWYIAGEGNAIMRRRLEAYRQRHALSGAQLDPFWLSSCGVNLMDDQHLPWLQSQAQYTGIPKLIILDTLSTNAIFNENDAEDASRLISRLNQVAITWGCTVLIVAHSGKDKNKSVRGSSVLQANPDFRFNMSRADEKGLHTMFSVEKLKGAAEPEEPLMFIGEQHTLFGVTDDRGQAVTDLVFRIGDPVHDRIRYEEGRRRRKLGERQAETYDLVKRAVAQSNTVASHGRGVLLEELWPLWQSTHPGDTRKQNFISVVEGLGKTRKGEDKPLLDIRTEVIGHESVRVVHLNWGSDDVEEA